MGLLLLVILLNTYIFILFKLFGNYGVNSLQAISINYLVCVLTGLAVHGKDVCTPCMVNEPWFTAGVLMGVYFIFLFNLLSYSTVNQGITSTTIANKLSLVIPVVFSWWLYSENLGMLKLAGILLAIPAVYFASSKKNEVNRSNLLIVISVFVFSGLMDTAIKYVQHTLLYGHEAQAGFTIVTFGVAGIVGTLIALVRIITGKDRFVFKNLIGGIALGIPNYFAIYYLIRLFDANLMPSSSIIPILNIGIVFSTAIAAIFVFKEHAGKQRVAGIILSLLSIVLIALSP